MSEPETDPIETEPDDTLARLRRSEARCRGLQATIVELEARIEALRGSARYRIGSAIQDALRSPRALLALPFELVSIVRAQRARTKRAKHSARSLVPPQATSAPAGELCPRTVAVPGSDVAGADGSHRHIVAWGEAEPVALSSAPKDIDIALEDATAVELVFKISGAAAGADASAGVDVQFLSGDGTPVLAREQRSTGRHIARGRLADGTEGFDRIRLQVPNTAARLRLRFSSKDTTVRLSPRIGCTLLRPGVSVIVPAFEAASRIERCLRTLAAQTLARDRFEIVIVLNGPDDGTQAIVEAFARYGAASAIRVLRSDPPGAGRARNIGIGAARFDHLTFLDDDDELTPDYLAALLALSDGRRVVVAPMGDVVEGIERESTLSQRLSPLETRRDLTHRDAEPAFSLNAAKLAPTLLLRAFAFPEDLRSGEDIVFWGDVCSRAAPAVALVSRQANARYLRHVRPGSVSRQTSGYDFGVAQRLAVIDRLDGMRADPDRPAPDILERRIKAQLQFVQRHLRTHPEDYAQTADDIAARAYAYPVDRILNGWLARTLVYSACFAPDLDPSAIVMAKRTAAFGEPVDVIANAMEGVRPSDPRLLELVAHRLGHLRNAGVPARFSHWPSIEEYAEEASRLAEDLEADKGAYREIYSRALWPASHFAAALHKLRAPQTVWTAEFSDPLRKDIRGAEREGALAPAWLGRHGIVQALRLRGFEPPPGDGLFAWCEVLPIALADRLVLTNESQLAYMASYQGDDRLRDALLAKAIVRPHPVPPEGFYELARPHSDLDASHANVAYFGSFYATRGLGRVLEAMAGLPAPCRERLRLHVFTPKPEEMLQAAEARGVAAMVRAAPYAGYLDFLALTRRFDYLLVVDAQTLSTHSVNPFLPSKLADYLGSKRPVWALQEAGSPLSRTELPAGSIRTQLNDDAAIARALAQIARATGRDGSTRRTRGRRQRSGGDSGLFDGDAGG